MKQPDAGEGTVGSSGIEPAQAIAGRLFASQPMPALSLAVARSGGVVWQTALG